MQWVPTILTASAIFFWLGFRHKPRSCEDWRITYNVAGIVLGNVCVAVSLLIMINYFCDLWLPQ